MRRRKENITISKAKTMAIEAKRDGWTELKKPKSGWATLSCGDAEGWNEIRKTWRLKRIDSSYVSAYQTCWNMTAKKRGKEKWKKKVSNLAAETIKRRKFSVQSMQTAHHLVKTNQWRGGRRRQERRSNGAAADGSIGVWRLCEEYPKKSK